MSELLHWFMSFLDFIIHIDHYLDMIFQHYGTFTIGILFIIVFCETGLVITPFLPGDSLLFAAGALAARGYYSVHLMVALLIVAGILGDGVNYHVGRFLGPKILSSKKSWWLNPEHLKKTQMYFEKYGGKTIILARFMPIVRTLAPFMSGVGKMDYSRFLFFNVIGAVLWVASFSYIGFFFGELEQVKKNFTLIIIAIVILSYLPAVFEWWRLRKPAKG